MVLQFITFKVKVYDIYGWWIYYILVNITFMVNFNYIMVGITFMCFITFMGNTKAKIGFENKKLEGKKRNFFFISPRYVTDWRELPLISMLRALRNQSTRSNS